MHVMHAPDCSTAAQREDQLRKGDLRRPQPATAKDDTAGVQVPPAAAKAVLAPVTPAQAKKPGLGAAVVGLIGDSTIFSGLVTGEEIKSRLLSGRNAASFAPCFGHL